jgi:hypothetical protein
VDDLDYDDEYSYVDEIFDSQSDYRGLGVDIPWNKAWWEGDDVAE